MIVEIRRLAEVQQQLTEQVRRLAETQHQISGEIRLLSENQQTIIQSYRLNNRTLTLTNRNLTNFIGPCVFNGNSD